MEDDLCHPIQLAKYRYSHLSQFASLRLIRQPGGPDRAFRSIVRSGTGADGEGVLRSHQSHQFGLDDMRVIGHVFFCCPALAAPWFLFLFPWVE